MKSKQDLNNDILNILSKIEKQFPELSKYIVEMPDRFSDASIPEININNLQDYYDSLHALLKNYSRNYAGPVKSMDAFQYACAAAKRNTAIDGHAISGL